MEAVSQGWACEKDELLMPQVGVNHTPHLDLVFYISAIKTSLRNMILCRGWSIYRNEEGFYAATYASLAAKNTTD